MEKKQLLDTISKAAEGEWPILDLSHNQLTELPQEIGRLGSLQRLKLNGNLLNELPPEIGRLKSLTHLDANENKIKKISSEIFRLNNLSHLSLRGNQLAELPDELSELKKLTELHLGFNRLWELPGSVTDLTNLQRLYLYGNKLAELPAGIAGLEELIELRIFGNLLEKLPEEIGMLRSLLEFYAYDNKFSEFPNVLTRLKTLLILYIGGNQLTELPADIAKLENLSVLDIGSNKLEDLPPEIGQLKNLIKLNAAGNRLRSLPSEIAGLEKLDKLEVDDNPIQIPPPEVVARGVDAISGYFRQLEDEDKDYLFEAKLLIVGEPGAGKTTFAQKIQNTDYGLNHEEISTEGIDIIRWDFPMENGQKFRVNIWDFGGQEIYHATHQFFLTKRSLYALVADTRREDTDLYYWLNVVKVLSADSPLLIIKNEVQDRHREIDDSLLLKQFSVKEICSSNLATNRGLPEILGNIKHYITRLPHIGSTLPKTWVNVRKILEEDERDYIGVDTYFDICKANGFVRRSDQLNLSGYLHDLGSCLHFQDDSLLKGTVILKPEWGTSAVYKVLDNKGVLRNRGMFHKKDLANIWSEEKYANMIDELLQLMMKFQLCYEVPGTSGLYIAPQLLTGREPDYDWEERGNLLLRYRYEFMPKGIITRFIVIMNEWIENQKLVWKNGVILQNEDTKTRAKVVEDPVKREIRIRVTGKQRKDFMTIIVHELDKIHESFHRLRFSKLVPCNCDVCKSNSDEEKHFYDFKKLKEYISNSRREVPCDVKPYHVVDVLSLIEDVIEGKIDDNENMESAVVYKGEDETPQIEIRSAWVNGSFYVFSILAVMSGLAYWAQKLPVSVFGAVVCGGLLITLLIGVIHLKYEQKLEDEHLFKLVKMVISKLPGIKEFMRPNTKQPKND